MKAALSFLVVFFLVYVTHGDYSYIDSRHKELRAVFINKKEALSYISELEKLYPKHVTMTVFTNPDYLPGEVR